MHVNPAKRPAGAGARPKAPSTDRSRASSNLPVSWRVSLTGRSRWRPRNQRAHIVLQTAPQVSDKVAPENLEGG